MRSEKVSMMYRAGLPSLLIWGLLIWGMSACSPITFVQYEQPGRQEPLRQWHHTVINGMVEVSKPLNLEEKCQGKTWNRLTTKRTFLNILVSIPVPTIDFLVPYVAWTNEVECYEANANSATDQG